MPDDTQFEDLYRSSYARLVAQLYVVTTDRVEAEEVVQEAFARLWAHWGRLREYDNCEAWVRRVAMNTAISRWRRHSRVKNDDFEGHFIDAEVAMVDLALVLRDLPIRYRQALLLYEVVGLSVDEVAAELSTKAGTVKSWLSRGRAALGVLWQEGPRA